MRQQFEDYLKAKGLAENTIRSRISNCKRVEEYEGNLDRLFDDDELRDLERRLSYTRDDQGAGRPLNHKIPIDGDEYTGSASLKASVRLYRAFRNYQNEGSPPVTPIGATHQTSKKLLHSKSLQWPVWPQPQPDEELALARIVARYARFLRPEIVQAIVEDNEKHRAIWSEALAQRRSTQTPTSGHDQLARSLVCVAMQAARKSPSSAREPKESSLTRSRLMTTTIPSKSGRTRS